MTWEFVVFLSVLAICGTVLNLFHTPQDSESMKKLNNRVNDLLERLAKTEERSEKIEKLAKEIERTVSAKNFAASFPAMPRAMK